MFYSTAQDLTGRGKQLGSQLNSNIANFNQKNNNGMDMKASIMSTFVD